MRTLLLTAFGPFPGHPVNPTPAVVEAVAAGELAHRGDIGVVVRVFPTAWEALDDLPRLLDAVRPDIALHLGLAGRARSVRVETGAANFCEPSRLDAAGCLAGRDFLEAGGLRRRRVTIPVSAVRDAISGLGLPCSLSRDAGDYLCNALLYRSLALAPPERRVGFLHVPPTDDIAAPRRRARAPSIARLAEAVVAAADAILAEAEEPKLRPNRAGAPGNGPLQSPEKAIPEQAGLDSQ